MDKRILLKVLVALLFLVSFVNYADEVERQVLVTENLQQVATLAKQKQLPVMMFFAAEDCEFCELLEADYLGAMSSNGEYRDKVIIRKVMIDSYENIIGFDGKNVSAEDFSEQFNVQVTPTLLLVNYRGVELTKKIVGYNRSGFFGAYLDEAINEAKRKVREALIKS